MLNAFKLPALAEGVDSAVIIAIHVKLGDRIESGQIVAVLENDKATAELPAPFAGIVREIHKKEGDEIFVGETLLSIEVSENSDGEPEEATSPQRDDGPERTTEETEGAVEDSKKHVPRRAKPRERLSPEPALPSSSEVVLPAGPEVRRLARELGVDLHDVMGTGPRSRIKPEDVRVYTRQMLKKERRPNLERLPRDTRFSLPGLPDFTLWGEVEVQRMTAVRRKTAEVVSVSWQQIPHVVQHDRADITELKALQESWQKRADQDGVHVTVTAILLKAVASALKVFPRFNCSVDMDNHALVYKKYIHIAVAVDAGYGLLTPVIREVDKRSVFFIAKALATVSAQARDNQLSVDEMAGSTFMVSNLGALGTTDFAPIIAWPNVAVLGVGKAEMQPTWRNNDFYPRKILPLSLSYDHRANDGADAARFLRWIAEALEDPLKIIMEAG